MSRRGLSRATRTLLLILLASEPFRCGIPTVVSFAAEMPAPVMITRGATAQGFEYLSGGVSSEERIRHLQVPKGKRVRQTLTWDLGEQSEVLKR